MFLLNILWYLWSLGKCFTISFIKIFPTLILTWLPYRELSHITLLISTRLTEPCLWYLFFLLKHHSFLKLCHNPLSLSEIHVRRKIFLTYFRKHSSWWRRLEGVFCLRLQTTSSRRLQGVLIKTNIFALLIRLQKTSSRRLHQDQHIRLGHTSSRRLQDVFKTSSRRLAKTSSRHLQDVLQGCLQDVLKTYHQVKLFA